jgi:predicted RNA binding protein YcfA (HicA-like mRNA interferase family)
MKGKELVKLLIKEGWQLDRINGSHHIMEKNGQVVSVPVHSKDLPKGTLTAICKKAGVKTGGRSND